METKWVTPAARRWWWDTPPQQRTQLILCARLLVMVGVSFAIAYWWLTDQARRTESLAHSYSAEAASLHQGSDAPRPSVFTERLPIQLRTAQVVRDATSWADEFNLRLSSLTVQPAAASPTDLQHTSVAIGLTGSYPNLKLWLREMLGRYPEMAVVSLDIQQTPNRTEGAVSATLQLRLHGKSKGESSTMVFR